MSGEYGLVSACSTSVRLCGQARANFKCVTAAFEPTVTWTKPLYIILHSSLTPLPPPIFSSLFFFLPSRPKTSLCSSRYVTLCALLHLVTQLSAEAWENVCRETDWGGLLFMITWKTIVFWYWLGDLQSVIFYFILFIFFLEQVQPRGLVMDKGSFFIVNEKNTNMGGKCRRWKRLFSGQSVFSHFKVAYYWLHLCFHCSKLGR